MVTVTTYEELAAAVRRDEPTIRLEGEAKYYYERNISNALGGGAIGALAGLMAFSPVGALAGAAIGAAIGTAQGRDKDVQRFLLIYYRSNSKGVTFIELSHR